MVPCTKAGGYAPRLAGTHGGGMRLPRLARLSLPSLQSELFSRFALSVIACGVSLAIGLGLHHQRIKRSRRRWPQGVEVRPSRIRGAGEGLFASRTFEAGEELGEYYGQVLSLWQAMNLQNRDYLMGGFGCAAPSEQRQPRCRLPRLAHATVAQSPAGSMRTSTRISR